jgi:hypothetical protein
MKLTDEQINEDFDSFMDKTWDLSKRIPGPSESHKYGAHFGYAKAIEQASEAIARREVLESLRESTLFKNVNIGVAAEIEAAALKDKEKLLGIAERHGLPVLLYSLYSLGFYSGKKSANADWEAEDDRKLVVIKGYKERQDELEAKLASSAKEIEGLKLKLHFTDNQELWDALAKTREHLFKAGYDEAPLVSCPTECALTIHEYVVKLEAKLNEAITDIGNLIGDVRNNVDDDTKEYRDTELILRKWLSYRNGPITSEGK